MGTEYLFDAAKAALEGEQLGTDDIPDILAISVSTHDYVSHFWGQESWERLDLLLRLDDTLGQFLDHLDNTIGKDQYVVVVASDHGGTPMVERTSKTTPALRITRRDMVTISNAAASKVLGKGTWVEACAAATMYVSDAFRAAPAQEQERALDAIVAALERTRGVGYAARVDRIAGNCDRREGIEQLACTSVVPGRSGEVFLATEPGSLLMGVGEDSGTGHGNPTDHDRFVPVIISAPDGRRGISTERAMLTQVAATVTTLVGSSPPEAAAPPLNFR